MRCLSIGAIFLTVFCGVVLIAERQERGSSPTLLIDGHVHITNRVYFEQINPWEPQPVGPFDYARARLGGANVVFENIAPYGYEDYNGVVKQVGRLIETFHRTLEQNRDKMALALTGADVRRIVASNRMAVVLGIEGGWDQDGDIDILRLWYRLGVRSIVFAGRQTNAFADSASDGGEKWNGINDRGRRLIEEMNRLGMLIDITHATPAAQRQIIAVSRAPVIASHTRIQLENTGAGMPIDVLKALVAKGGVIGLTGGAQDSPEYVAWARLQPGLDLINGLSLADATRPNFALVRNRAPDFQYGEAFDSEMGSRWRRYWSQPFNVNSGTPLPDVDVFAQYVAKVVTLGGAAHVGIGMDFFQGRAYFKDFHDATGYTRLAEALRARGVPDMVLGENWLRVLDSAEVSESTSSPRSASRATGN